MSTQGFFAVLLIVLGLGQLSVLIWEWRALSLIGDNKFLGGMVVILLLTTGVSLLPAYWSVLWLALPAGLLAVGLMLLTGSFILPPPHPDRIFNPNYPGHSRCEAVFIPDGKHPAIPGFLLYPLGEPSGGAVCIVPGAGDTKVNFKWRQIEAFLEDGLIVLTFDPPGHGQYRHRPMTYPDCLSAVPAAVNFLRNQPNVEKVALLGISLGGALALRSLIQQMERIDATIPEIDALVVFATPLYLNYSKAMFYREAWRTIFRAPTLSLFREMTVRQVRQSWNTGGYRSTHNTAEMIELLEPLESIKKLPKVPILLVYSRRDSISPLSMAHTINEFVPEANLIEVSNASHVTIILTPWVNRKVSNWLKVMLESREAHQ